MQTNARTHGIVPIYFGGQSRQLFGCYQTPMGPTTRRTGILLCHPVGPEYIRSHRAFRQLAVRLSQAGFGVLRYDHFGCGDSAGQFEQCQLSDWLDALPLAIHEMRTTWPHTDVCVAGLRLGATLSLISAAKTERVTGMVLWDSVVDGHAYIQSLKDWHASTIASGAIPQLPPHHLDETHTEILGYPFSAVLIDEITRINALAVERAPADRVLMIDAADEPCCGPLREHLQQLGAMVEFHKSTAPQIWRQEPYQAVVPHEVMTSIVAWIAGVFE